MKNIRYYPLEKEIKEPWKLYAHTLESRKEKLEEHLDKTVDYLKKIDKEKDLRSVLENFYRAFDLQTEEKELFDEMFFNTFYMHDVGKCNVNFQLTRMKNPQFNNRAGSNSDHALLSSAIYIEYFLNRIREEGVRGKQRLKLHTYMLLNAYIISKHHGHLYAFENFKDQLESLYLENEAEKESNVFALYHSLSTEGRGKFFLGPKVINRLFEDARKLSGTPEKEGQELFFYIYTKLMYSLLVACDFYATSDYMEQQEIQDLGGLKQADIWEAAYKESQTYQAIMGYQKQRMQDLSKAKEINVLRSEMFLEAVEGLKKQSDENLFYLEAPTGSGKTNTSIQLALMLLKEQKKNKVFYVFPFNTLVEQTKKALDTAFESNKDCSSAVTVVNSLTPIANKQETDDEEEMNYNRMLLDRQFFHYPWVITSHVQFFNLLFGVGREDGVGLYQLVNSVVILDEVQSYKNAIWTEMISFLKTYASLFNMKIIIMSATLPGLDQLITKKARIPFLLKDSKKYFGHSLFKERVHLDFSLLEIKEVYEPLMDKVIQYARKENKKILVEFINKKTAMKFYNDLLERMSDESHKPKIMLLTGDDSMWERDKCIRLIKDKSCQNVVLIATQLVEAGVDIDMDVGFKDISLLDAEEQFLGRINRSCKKSGCCAYFFNLDNASVLYKKDCRKEKTMTLLQTEMQQILIEKDFKNYYEKIFKALTKQNQACTADNLENFKKEGIQALRYDKVRERMQLIDEELYPDTVFLGIEIEVEEQGKLIKLDGKKIWQEYIALLNDKTIPYAEKKVKLSKLQPVMNGFMWKVKPFQNSYTAHVGHIFYIEDGSQYMENGKFNRELLSGSGYEIL